MFWASWMQVIPELHYLYQLLNSKLKLHQVTVYCSGSKWQQQATVWELCEREYSEMLKSCNMTSLTASSPLSQPDEPVIRWDARMAEFYSSDELFKA